MMPLLEKNEPLPFAIKNQNGNSSLVFICEHAGHRLPKKLGNMGLSEKDRYRHFIWDLGALELSKHLSAHFDAPLLYQRYSRLVCDCNRRPDVSSYIPVNGEEVSIEVNEHLDASDIRRRTEEIWQPFHHCVSQFLDQRDRKNQFTLLISIHSFTPIFFAQKRPWHIGVLYDKDAHLSPTLLSILQNKYKDKVGDNEPYKMSRESDYTIPIHGEDRHYPCCEIEVRNDLIVNIEGVSEWATVISDAVSESCKKLNFPLTI